MTGGFGGAKVAILSRDRVVTLLRDDDPDIPWPGYWDLPGGGREGDETPAECVRRETFEETGLRLAAGALTGARRYGPPESGAWFFAAHLPDLSEDDLRLGNEGQALLLMPVARFLACARAIPTLRRRLGAFLGRTG